MTAGAVPPALEVGPLRVWPPVVLAPMAGVTNAPFRRLCRSFLTTLPSGDDPSGPGGTAVAVEPPPAPTAALPGPPSAMTAAPPRPPSSPSSPSAPSTAATAATAAGGLFVSEMITARGLVERNERTLRMARFSGDEPVRSVQLYGTDPASVGEAVRFLVAEAAADHVDLNFGCPAAKVTRKGGGAALPVRRALLRDVVRAAVRGAGPVPVTVKLRIGIDERLTTFLDAGRIARDEGVAAVALHARTAAQHYSGQADWGAIATLRAALPDVAVLGNGDVWQATDALRMVAETGCDGVVVGRGCLGRPWLFGDLAVAFAGRPVPPSPPLSVVAAVLARHARLLAAWLGEPQAVRDVRKHVAWYLHGYPVGAEARDRLVRTSSIAELEGSLATLVQERPGLGVVDGADRRPRGRTSGPVAVVLPEGWTDDPDDPAPPPATDELDAVSGG